MLDFFRFPATREEALALAQRAALATLRALTVYVVTPAAAIASHAKTFALSYVPSYVSQVIVVDTLTRVPQVREIYRASDYYFSWHRSHHTTTYLSDTDCYYAVTVWDSEAPGYRSYFLSSHHICRALGIRSVGNWWALSDFGIVTQLRAYIASMRASSMGMYEISVGKKYLLSDLSEYQKSLELPKNVSAKALIGFLSYILPGSVELPKAVAPPPAAAAPPAPVPVQTETATEPPTEQDSPVPTDPPALSDTEAEAEGFPASHPLTPPEPPAPAPPVAPKPTAHDDFIYEVVVMNYELEEYSCRNSEPLLAL